MAQAKANVASTKEEFQLKRDKLAADIKESEVESDRYWMTYNLNRADKVATQRRLHESGVLARQTAEMAAMNTGNLMYHRDNKVHSVGSSGVLYQAAPPPAGLRGTDVLGGSTQGTQGAQGTPPTSSVPSSTGNNALGNALTSRGYTQTVGADGSRMFVPPPESPLEPTMTEVRTSRDLGAALVPEMKNYGVRGQGLFSVGFDKISLPDAKQLVTGMAHSIGSQVRTMTSDDNRKVSQLAVEVWAGMREGMGQDWDKVLKRTYGPGRFYSARTAERELFAAFEQALQESVQGLTLDEARRAIEGATGYSTGGGMNAAGTNNRQRIEIIKPPRAQHQGPVIDISGIGSQR